MAKAIMTTPKPVKTPPYTITLTLSQIEAEVLLKVMRKIGGSTDKSARKYTDNIEQALTSCKVMPYDIYDDSHLEKMHTSLYFTDDLDI